MRNLINILIEAVSLSRDPTFQSNIPYQAGNLYRIIGQDGLRDFETSGKLRANPSGKGGYQHAYYQQGKANAIYAGGGRGDVVAEVEPQEGRFERSSDDGYYRTFPNQEITKRDKVRIWVKNNETNQHEIKFDNINDDVTRNHANS